MIEKYYCDGTGKTILFQSTLEIQTERDTKEKVVVSRVIGAIQEVAGLTYSQYIDEDRGNEGFFARMLFANHCKKGGVEPERIIAYIPRNRSTILYYLRKYNDECKYNCTFRDLAERMNLKLYPDKITLSISV